MFGFSGLVFRVQGFGLVGRRGMYYVGVTFPHSPDTTSKSRALGGRLLPHLNCTAVGRCQNRCKQKQSDLCDRALHHPQFSTAAVQFTNDIRYGCERLAQLCGPLHSVATSNYADTYAPLVPAFASSSPHSRVSDAYAERHAQDLT